MTSTSAVSQVDPGSFSWDSPFGVSADVRRVVAAATASDGRGPLDEAAVLSLRHSGLTKSALWVASSSHPELSGGGGAIATPAPDKSVIGFALADAPPGTSGDVEVNLVVAPTSRGKGVGRNLAAAAFDVFPDARVSAWSHGNHPAAATLASSFGFDRVRDLWIMRRSLRDLPEVRDVEATVVRTFEPGRDEDAFLELNALAFADHPEQGSLTRTDLEQRMAEDWFDPTGFFLAETPAGSSDPGRLVGFHWTKVHAMDPPYGEVYVVGVSPDAQGMGLGKVLTLTGLHHLRSRGLDEVILHVGSDNAAAVKVYAGLGFAHAEEDTDVMYRRARATSRR